MQHGRYQAGLLLPSLSSIDRRKSPTFSTFQWKETFQFQSVL